jgi:hypothetical protein
MLLSGAISILTSLDKPSREFAENTNAASVKIYPYTADENAVYRTGKQFETLDSVKSVEYTVTHYVYEDYYLNGEKVEAFADLTEYNDRVFGNAYYLEGSRDTGNFLKEDECILSAGISTEYGIHIGDTVTFGFTGGNVVYKVAAVYSDPYQTSTAFDSDILVKNYRM